MHKSLSLRRNSHLGRPSTTSLCLKIRGGEKRERNRSPQEKPLSVEVRAPVETLMWSGRRVDGRGGGVEKSENGNQRSLLTGNFPQTSCALPFPSLLKKHTNARK